MRADRRWHWDRKLISQAVGIILLLGAAVTLSMDRYQIVMAVAAPLDEAVVRCEPEVISGGVGETVVVDLYVENVIDLYGADVRPAFDTAIVQAEDADSYPGNGVQLQPLGDLLSPDFVVKNEIDNDAGTVWYAVTQLNPSPEVSGEGPIARLFLHGTAPGSFSMQFDYVKLVQRNGVEIDSVQKPCIISFGEPSTSTLTVTSTPTDTLTPTFTPTPFPTSSNDLYLPLVLRSSPPLPTPTPTATFNPTPSPTPSTTPGVTPPPGSVSIPNLDSINDIAVDPPTDRVYLTSRELGLVYVLDGLSNEIVAQFPVCDLPYGIDLNSSTRRGYVGCYNAGTLAVLDIDTNSVIGQIPVGPEPTYPSVIETTNRIYIPTHGNHRLVEIDGQSQTVNRSAFAGYGVFGLVINEDLNQAYITARDMLSIITIDLDTMQEIDGQNVKTGGIPFGLGFNSETGNLYVSSFFEGYDTHVDVYQPQNTGLQHLKTLQTPNGGLQMGGRIGVNPGTNHIFVVNTQNQSITVVDGADNSIKITARFGMALYGVDVAVMSNQVYIGGREQNVLWIIPDNF